MAAYGLGDSSVSADSQDPHAASAPEVTCRACYGRTHSGFVAVTAGRRMTACLGRPATRFLGEPHEAQAAVCARADAPPQSLEDGVLTSVPFPTNGRRCCGSGRVRPAEQHTAVTENGKDTVLWGTGAVALACSDQGTCTAVMGPGGRVPCERLVLPALGWGGGRFESLSATFFRKVLGSETCGANSLVGMTRTASECRLVL